MTGQPRRWGAVGASKTARNQAAVTGWKQESGSAGLAGLAELAELAELAGSGDADGVEGSGVERRGDMPDSD
jgi:hypothetical protein